MENIAEKLWDELRNVECKLRDIENGQHEFTYMDEITAQINVYTGYISGLKYALEVVRSFA